MTYISKDIDKAVELLEKGQVIGIPTETVYGLAGNALDPSVVYKIYEIKKRPITNPLILHLPDTNQLNKYVKNIPAVAEKLIENFCPGALTLLLPKKEIIPDIITAGLPNVAVRIPNHPMALQLLSRLSFPLAAPSANPFGYISPTTAADVERTLFGKIDFILDGGSCSKGIESTIVGFDGEIPIIYRVGAISYEAIKKLVGKVEINNKHNVTSISPGMLPAHYAPHTPLYLTNNIEALLKTVSCVGTAILSFQNSNIILSNTCTEFNEAKGGIPKKNQEVLSSSGNLDEAAQNLYKALHRLDSLKLERIIAERVPNIGIGMAINDRLERAANKTYINE